MTAQRYVAMIRFHIGSEDLRPVLIRAGDVLEYDPETHEIRTGSGYVGLAPQFMVSVREGWATPSPDTAPSPNPGPRPKGTPLVSTGSSPLDILLQGGVPKGSLVYAQLGNRQGVALFTRLSRGPGFFSLDCQDLSVDQIHAMVDSKCRGPNPPEQMFLLDVDVRLDWVNNVGGIHGTAADTGTVVWVVGLDPSVVSPAWVQMADIVLSVGKVSKAGDGVLVEVLKHRGLHSVRKWVTL